MEINIGQARKDTPASSAILHFNNAGASLIPLPVQRAVTAYQDAEYNLGGYETYDRYVADHKAVYEKIATLIGATADEIVLTTSASHSYGMAVQSLQLKAGDKVLCCHAEYISNYMALLLQKRQGVEIVLIPNDDNGQIDLDILEKSIDGRTRLISLTHIPTSGGLINPAEEVGRIAKKHGILYLLDACQSVGQIQVDVKAIGCDLLAATGRKYMRGPRGTGFLFVKDSVLPRTAPAIVDGWGGEWTALHEFSYRDGRSRLELYEKNYAAFLGLGAAAEYALSWGMDAIEGRNVFLADLLRDRLSSVKGITVRDQGVRKGGIVTFTMNAKDHLFVHQELRKANMHTSVSSGAAARLDLGMRGIENVIRASVHYYNTEDEIERFVRKVGSF